MMYLMTKKTGPIMWIAVPITNNNPGNFYHDLNELTAKNDMHKLNMTCHMPPELNPTRLTVAPLAHTLNSNLDYLLLGIIPPPPSNRPLLIWAPLKLVL